nr:MAG TPA: hypothetical protein [Bacteriophage sp.]
MVVEPFLSDLDADCPLLQYLGHIVLICFYFTLYYLTNFFCFRNFHAHIILVDITL